jgi:hypothetical protein
VAGGTDGLASGGNHLCNEQPHQWWRPPQHRRQRPPLYRWAAAASARTKRSSLPSSYVVRTRPSKNATAAPTAYDVLYDPRCGQRRGRSHGCGRHAHGATVARAVDGQPHPDQAAGGSVGGGTEATQAKAPGTRRLAAPAVDRPRVPEVRLLRKAGERPSPPNAGGRSGPPAHAEGGAPTRLALLPGVDDEHP